ncbi:hypothetical protein ENSA5_67590 [Enhygromyxa salina]|uniref:Uncharacterized protein n=1 Tax=Enhygromyxa salina TaxID=215803 RepID=A0A2S9XBT3_9BACT|nr:hypothetical protein [Enhygromyxa salina]PRP90141.1 hypothetical protein ENSA5_67590 [Enhygromyxa salina]
MVQQYRAWAFAWLLVGCVADDGSAGDASTDTSDTSDTSAETDGDGDGDGDGDTSAGATTYQGEVWADNWSSMYVGETLVMEDSVSITTERSFNAEVFTFEATPPFLINVVMKDFIENDSGLEYIGEPNQQMGDGGYIAQITDLDSGEVVAVSSSEWTCLTIHEAPLNTDCEDDPNPEETCEAEISDEPAAWKSEDFDDSAWTNASEYTEAEVSPKEGYNEITWDASATLIWGADLQTHNTILCRAWVMP